MCSAHLDFHDLLLSPTYVKSHDLHLYKFKCKSCDFTYVGESKRSWKSRWAEHKPGTRRMIESSIKEHAETTGHDVQSDDAHILEKGVMNYHKRLFLESFHSCNDNDSRNEHKHFPKVYIPFLKVDNRNNGYITINS